MSKPFEVGDVCKSLAHPQCFFTPGSVVIITDKGDDGGEIVSAKLLFGEVNDRNGINLALEDNSDDDGAVHCYVYELEKIHE